MSFHDIKFSFAGRRVLVIGGSRGIGKALVVAFVESGADVTYGSRTAMIGPTIGRHFPIDIRSETQILAMFDELDRLGPLDILVNVAAINHYNSIEKIATKEWDDIVDVNLRAAFLICREATRRMKPRRFGKIVNVSSIAGRHRSPVAGVHYVSTKAGLIGLTRQLAFELAPYDINVNVVCPSQTMTDMLAEAMTPERIAQLEKTIPLGRIATVEEQVGPILFLCSDAASYITGAALDINGGQI